MKRIPYGKNWRGVFDNLTGGNEVLFAAQGEPDLLLPFSRPLWDLEDLSTALKALFGPMPGLSNEEIEHFSNRMLQYMTSCEARRFGEYEHMGWWEFIDADQFSDAYRQYLAIGLTRNLVALQAEIGNARTVASMFSQFLYSLLGYNEEPDRVLDGPTNDVWIDPWLAHLQNKGVRYRFDAVAERIHMSGDRITGVDVKVGDSRQTVKHDHYIFALPVEALTPLLDSAVLAADPSLGELFQLHTAWMNGIQIYFDREVPLVKGHLNFVGTPWALSSVSQAQFWHDYDLANFGDGNVRDILSICISNWEVPGILYGKRADQCTKQEIFDEVWAQIDATLNDEGPVLEKEWIVDWFLDPSITFPGPNQVANAEPLLINTKSSWALRPDAITGIENMYLAADYVRTNIDLATMESANEAARMATNGILDSTRSWQPRCQLWKLFEPLHFEDDKANDAIRYNLGLRHILA
jgi:uncharacterized protein with NAD-binding domain and iron-sulfur cluster